MTSQRAFTLIEVMVALAVVSIIGVLSFRAVAAAADTQQHLAQSNERWQDIVRLVRRIDSDLIADRAVAPAAEIGRDDALGRTGIVRRPGPDHQALVAAIVEAIEGRIPAQHRPLE